MTNVTRGAFGAAQFSSVEQTGIILTEGECFA